MEGARGATSSLDEIERIVVDSGGDLDLHEVGRRARRRACALTGSGKPDPATQATAVAGFAADLVAAVAPRLAESHSSLRTVIDRLETTTRLPRCLLGREVMRAPQLLRLPALDAVEVSLALALAFTQARAAMLWVHAPDAGLTVLASSGEVDAMPLEARELAGKVIAGESVCALAGGEVAVAAIHRGESPAAALVVFGEDVLSPKRRLLLEATEPVLMLALERLQPLAVDGGPAEQSTETPHDGDGRRRDAGTAAERRLTRLRLDLHDGPQQDVLMLTEDLKLFRSQLESLVSSGHRGRVLGWIDDLGARLIALDGDLRRISVSVESPFLHQKSFEDALRAVVEGFRARSGLTPSVRVEGDFTGLTDSQHITLLGLIREALSNVCEHSQADHVVIAISAQDGAVTVRVTDDGGGFDPETMLVRAARNGRLGLVGMHERVRLLGGSTTITSRPGGPTVIAATLPPAPAGAPRRAG